jgi:CDGSH-type Zn-finger protein
MKIKIVPNGPYLVSGNIPLYKETNEKYKMSIPLKWIKVKKYETKENYALCRCGLSKNKPFCDGSHRDNFKDDKLITKEDLDNLEAVKYEGLEYDLLDIKPLCSSARFCLRDGGIWKLLNKEGKEEIIKEIAFNCPSGRLVIFDKNGSEIEPDFEPEISILEDTVIGLSGPIWVKGRAPIEYEENKFYKIRNRVTLCRCGLSKNKPFCDGTHVKAKFKDE